MGNDLSPTTALKTRFGTVRVVGSGNVYAETKNDDWLVAFGIPYSFIGRWTYDHRTGELKPQGRYLSESMYLRRKDGVDREPSYETGQKIWNAVEEALKTYLASDRNFLVKARRAALMDMIQREEGHAAEKQEALNKIHEQIRVLRNELNQLH